MAPLVRIDSIGLRTGWSNFFQQQWHLAARELGELGERVIQPATDVALKQLIGGLGEL